jgi:LacI family gluconate utilization system Gnt-I transcriptional repressor
MTVSRALRGVEGVSEAKRAEIARVAKRLNYVPNNNARSLAVANSMLIGISLPTLFNDVFADVLEGMRGALNAAGFETIIDTTEYDEGREEAWVDRLLSWSPAGLILTGVHHRPVLRERLRSARVPVLEIWDCINDPIDICVGIDHLGAGVTLGRHAAGLGYRRPGFVGAPLNRDPRAEARLQGLSMAFSEIKGATVRTARPAEGSAFETGYVGALMLLEEAGERPDIVFFLNDHLAFGGLMACVAKGLDVPRDIGIAGFNGLPITNVLTTRLTTLRTPRRLMGATGARNLLARIHGVKCERSTTLPIELVCGETTRRQENGVAGNNATDQPRVE